MTIRNGPVRRGLLSCGRARARAAWLLLLMGLTGACAGISSGGSTGVALGAAPAEPRRLRVIDYVGSDEAFANPERGFFGWASSMGAGPGISPIELGELRALRARGVTLVRIFYVLDEFRSAPLSPEALARLQNDFDVVREAGLKAIPRFAYNFPTGELATDFAVVDDAPVERVIEHIDALAPVLRRNSDVLAFLEAGFVGAWGEWHHSSNRLIEADGRANVASRAIIERLLSALPSGRMVALRYPVIKQQLFGDAPLADAEAFTGTPKSRLGAHNDCFLRDQVDSGTYSRFDEYVPPGAFIEAQKDYLRQDNRFLPQAGETCAADAAAAAHIRCRTALRDLARMRWSALNLEYHPAVIAKWKRDDCLDEVGRRLGYRFSLRTARYPTTVSAGEPFELSFTVLNEGWAAPFNARRVELILRHVVSGEQHAVVARTDPRLWGAGETHSVDIRDRLPPDLAPGRYELLLNLPDPDPGLRDRPDYSIRLANADSWEPRTGFNRLHGDLLVVARN